MSVRTFVIHSVRCLLISAILFLTACSGSPSPPSGDLPASEINTGTKAEIETYLERLSALGFSGAVLVAHKGDVLVSSGYGMADEQNPNTADTIFNIGSNTKPFTAAAILKLRDQKRLQLEDELPTFFDDVPVDKQHITVRQLLTHSSGLEHTGTFQGDFEEVERDDAVRRILNSDLLFPPGAESSYSDLGYILLAVIVEKASGKSYQDYVRSELLNPAGLDSTGWWGNDANLAGKPFAQGTSFLGEPNVSAKTFPGPFWAIQGAGGMVSTVTDLQRWHEAVHSGLILSPQSITDYETGHFQLSENEAEGYGWVVAEPVPGRVMRISAGGAPQIGHENIIQWWTAEDWLIIVSTNNPFFQAGDISYKLSAVVFGDPYALPPQVIPAEEEILNSWQGSYLIENGGLVSITTEDGRLVITPEDQQAFGILFPAPDPKQDFKSIQENVVDYLNSGKDQILENWKSETSIELGEFKNFYIIGTSFGETPEPGTYISFEFENGHRYGWFIVNDEGALLAAQLDVSLPAMSLWLQSPTECVTFSIRQPYTLEHVRLEEVSQGLLLTTSDGATLPAKRVIQSGN